MHIQHAEHLGIQVPIPHSVLDGENAWPADVIADQVMPLVREAVVNAIARWREHHLGESQSPNRWDSTGPLPGGPQDG